MSMTWFSYAAGGERNMKISWPFLAWASDAARVFRSTRLMLSTVTWVLCFCPHSTANFLLNHSSNAGTKWLHCKILSVFCWAAARSGNRNAGPSVPAAILPAPAILMKSLRDTPLPFFSSFISPSSVPYAIPCDRQHDWKRFAFSLPLFTEALQVFRNIARRNLPGPLHHDSYLFHNIGVGQRGYVSCIHLIGDGCQHSAHDFT